MKRPKHAQDHYAAPKAWRHVPDITGDYDMDASIMHSKNKSVPSKLQTHTNKGTAYGSKSGYDGYSSYSGDD